MKKPLFTPQGSLIPQIDYEAVLEAVQKAVVAHGMKAVSKGLGLSYEQVRRMIDPRPEDEPRHLRLDRALHIMEITGDVGPLAEIAHQFGYRLDLMDVSPDQPTSMHEATQDGERMGERNKAMLEHQPPHVVEALNDALIEESKETVTAYTAEYFQGDVMRGGQWKRVHGAVTDERKH